MIRNLCYDTSILSKKSVDCTKDDLVYAKDLIDTLDAINTKSTFLNLITNDRNCVGMALNMIGILKRMIIFLENEEKVIMVNPEVIKYDGKSFETSEGCMCLNGEHKTIRYPKIKVKYLDLDYKVKIKTYEGFTAQIIQHELDHLEGILI